MLEIKTNEKLVYLFGFNQNVNFKIVLTSLVTITKVDMYCPINEDERKILNFIWIG
jgi:hypothetical protein